MEDPWNLHSEEVKRCSTHPALELNNHIFLHRCVTGQLLEMPRFVPKPAHVALRISVKLVNRLQVKKIQTVLECFCCQAKGG